MNIKSATVRVAERLGVLVAGLLLALLVLEVFLRLLGWLYERQVHSDRRVARAGGVTILCVGDSYTFGMGAPPEQSYPKQLERQLNASGNGRRYTVVNRGEPAQNSRLLLQNLSSNLESVRPDIVVVMTGLNICWNLRGYSEWASDDRQRLTALDDYLHRISVYRLAKLLYYNVIQKAHGETRFPWVAAAQGPQWTPPSGPMGSGSQIGPSPSARSLEPPPSRANKDDETADHDVPRERLVRARVEYGQARIAARNGNRDEAIAHLKRAAEANPYYTPFHVELVRFAMETRNREALVPTLTNALKSIRYREDFYIALANALQARNDPQGVVNALKPGAAAMPDSVRINELLGLNALSLQDFALARKALQAAYTVYPRFQSAHPLGCLYKDAREVRKAIECFEKAIEIDPEEGFTRSLPFLLQLFHDSHLDQECDAYLERLAKMRPDLAPALAELKGGSGKDGGFQRWILKDYEEVARLCQKRGVQAIFSTYPGPLDPNSSSVDLVSEAARLNQVPLVDNISAFRSRPDRDSCFVADGHCNEKGYGILAGDVARVILGLGRASPSPR